MMNGGGSDARRSRRRRGYGGQGVCKLPVAPETGGLVSELSYSANRRAAYQTCVSATIVTEYGPRKHLRTWHGCRNRTYRCVAAHRLTAGI